MESLGCFCAFRGMLPAEMVVALHRECQRDRIPYHKPTITPDHSTRFPGLGPDPVIYGTTLGMKYSTPATDKLYRIMKIDLNYCECASFHIHWTKSGDASELGNSVRWELKYTVFNGEVRELALVTPSTIVWNSEYDDDSTSGSRLACRTEDKPAEGFVAGYYVGLEVSVDAANTTLISDPVLLSVDMSCYHQVE